MENKPESGVAAAIIVRIWGMSSDGHPFFQNVRAANLTSDGASLLGIEYSLKPGDVIGVQHSEHKARFRVVWVVDGGAIRKLEAGIQILDGQQSPWAELVKVESAGTPAGTNKRRFVRYKVRLPIEISDERGRGAHMQTSATDVGGRGCYVETLMPLPLGTGVNVTFWLESEKISTAGIIRASDPGVGMGIEFTSLDYENQKRLQHFLEKLDPDMSGQNPSPEES